MATGQTNSYTRPGQIGLVFIEPKNPPKLIKDELSRRTANLQERDFKPVGSGWRGCHQCSCGVQSDNHDYQFKHYVSHSLLAHYVQYHRDEIPAADMQELLNALAIAEGKASSIVDSRGLPEKNYIVWSRAGQAPEGQPIKSGSYEACVEHLRTNPGLFTGRLAKAGYQPEIVTESGSRKSYVL